MKFLIFSWCAFVIFALAHCEDTADEDTGRTCITAGPMCDNCEHLVICVGFENHFYKLPLQTCALNETCLGNRCTTDRNPKCESEPDFPCNDIGVFPNPFDCQTYHFCVKENDGNLKEYRTKCDGNYGYHAGTTFCQTQLDNNACFQNEYQFPVDLCLHSGQNAALLQNPSIYYICARYSDTVEILYPFQFVCPHGGTYFNFECILARSENYNKLRRRF
ncbi:hypothetical protein Trydic_g9896 [Trypoxylus dichotomus]